MNQIFDILLKDGEIIDPARGVHELGSVAVQDGRIAAVGRVENTQARVVLDMRGKIVSPGLIDIHCHPAPGVTDLGVPADEVGLDTGVILLGDGGSAGAANFDALRRFVIQRAETEVVCFLNLASAGLLAPPEIRDGHDCDLERSRQVIEANRDLIKGVKIRAIQPLAESLGIRGVEMAKRLASDLSLPLMMHIGEARERVVNDRMDDFSRCAVSLLEKGDILSHYLTWEAGGMILKDGTIYPELDQARKRGVFLDSSHGLYHFNFTILRHALAQGFIPSVISTDMTAKNIAVVQSLAVTMSKFLNLGLTLDQVLAMTTVNAAKALGEEEKRGSLEPGRRADLTVLELLQGDFLLGDGKGCESLRGTQLLEPRMVFQAGKMKPAYSRYHIPPIFK